MPSDSDAVVCRMCPSRWRPHQTVATYFVCKGRKGYFSNVNDAITFAQPYSRIEVVGGRYHEAIVVDKPIEIGCEKGDEAAEFVSNAHTCTISAPECFLEGLVFKTNEQKSAVYIEGGKGVLVHCTMDSLEVGNDACPEITDNTIVGGKVHGIHVTSSASGTYRGNTIERHAWYGVCVDTTGTPTFSHNKIRYGEQGQVLVTGLPKIASAGAAALARGAAMSHAERSASSPNRYSGVRSKLNRGGNPSDDGGLKLAAEAPREDDTVQTAVKPVFLYNRIADEKAPAAGSSAFSSSGGLGMGGNLVLDSVVERVDGSVVQALAALRELPVKKAGDMVRLMPVPLQGNTRTALQMLQEDEDAENGLGGGAFDPRSAVEVASGAEPHFQHNTIVNSINNGIRIRDGSGGHFENNYFTNNRGWGMAVEDADSAPTLVGNIFTGNGMGGLRIKKAGGIVREKNEFVENRGPQVLVIDGHKDFLFTHNEVRSGPRVGVVVREGGGGTFVHNTFEYCNNIALKVESEAHPLVQENIFAVCSVGAMSSRNGRGHFVKNSFSNNRAACVVVFSGGDPIFEHCRMATSSSGVIISRGGKGTFDRCIVKDNRHYQVEVSGVRSNPTFHNCYIADGRECGAHVLEGAMGTFLRCTFTAHVRNHIIVRSGADPTIRDSLFLVCEGVGLQFEDGALGTVVGCVINKCHEAGILVHRKAAPTVRANRITLCRGSGLKIGEGGDGVFEKNEIIRNGKSNVYIAGAVGITTTDVTSGGGGASGGGGGGADGPAPAPVPCLRKNWILDALGAGVTITSHGTAVLMENSIHRSGRVGVQALSGATVAVLACSIDGAGTAGLMVADDSRMTVVRTTVERVDGVGLWTDSGARVSLLYSSFAGCGIGARLTHVSGIVMFCTFTGSKQAAILAGHACRAKITYCYIIHNKIGVALEHKCRAHLTANVLSENFTAAVLVRATDDASIVLENNTIASSFHEGIIVEGGGLSASGNLIANCRRGVVFTAAASEHACLSGEYVVCCLEGIVTEKGAAPRIDRSIIGHCDVGIATRSRSQPAVRHCIVHNCAIAGLYSADLGGGDFTDCSFFKSFINIAASACADHRVARSLLQAPVAYNAYYTNHSQCTLTACLVTSHYTASTFVYTASSSTSSSKQGESDAGGSGGGGSLPPAARLVDGVVGPNINVLLQQDPSIKAMRARLRIKHEQLWGAEIEHVKKAVQAVVQGTHHGSHAQLAAAQASTAAVADVTVPPLPVEDGELFVPSLWEDLHALPVTCFGHLEGNAAAAPVFRTLQKHFIEAPDATGLSSAAAAASMVAAIGDYYVHLAAPPAGPDDWQRPPPGARNAAALKAALPVERRHFRRLEKHRALLAMHAGSTRPALRDLPFIQGLLPPTGVLLRGGTARPADRDSDDEGGESDVDSASSGDDAVHEAISKITLGRRGVDGLSRLGSTVDLSQTSGPYSETARGGGIGRSTSLGATTAGGPISKGAFVFSARVQPTQLITRRSAVLFPINAYVFGGGPAGGFQFHNACAAGASSMPSSSQPPTHSTQMQQSVQFVQLYHSARAQRLRSSISDTVLPPVAVTSPTDANNKPSFAADHTRRHTDDYFLQLIATGSASAQRQSALFPIYCSGIKIERGANPLIEQCLIRDHAFQKEHVYVTNSYTAVASLPQHAGSGGSSGAQRTLVKGDSVIVCPPPAPLLARMLRRLHQWQRHSAGHGTDTGGGGGGGPHMTLVDQAQRNPVYRYIIAGEATVDGARRARAVAAAVNANTTATVGTRSSKRKTIRASRHARIATLSVPGSPSPDSPGLPGGHRSSRGAASPISMDLGASNNGAGDDDDAATSDVMTSGLVSPFVELEDGASSGGDGGLQQSPSLALQLQAEQAAVAKRTVAAFTATFESCDAFTVHLPPMGVMQILAGDCPPTAGEALVFPPVASGSSNDAYLHATRDLCNRPYQRRGGATDTAATIRGAQAAPAASMFADQTAAAADPNPLGISEELRNASQAAARGMASSASPAPTGRANRPGYKSISAGPATSSLSASPARPPHTTTSGSGGGGSGSIDSSPLSRFASYRHSAAAQQRHHSSGAVPPSQRKGPQGGNKNSAGLGDGGRAGAEARCDRFRQTLLLYARMYADGQYQFRSDGQRLPVVPTMFELAEAAIDEQQHALRSALEDLYAYDPEALAPPALPPSTAASTKPTSPTAVSLSAAVSAAVAANAAGTNPEATSSLVFPGLLPLLHLPPPTPHAARITKDGDSGTTTGGAGSGASPPPALQRRKSLTTKPEREGTTPRSAKNAGFGKAAGGPPSPSAAVGPAGSSAPTAPAAPTTGAFPAAVHDARLLAHLSPHGHRLLEIFSEQRAGPGADAAGGPSSTAGTGLAYQSAKAAARAALVGAVTYLALLVMPSTAPPMVFSARPPAVSVAQARALEAARKSVSAQQALASLPGTDLQLPLQLPAGKHATFARTLVGSARQIPFSFLRRCWAPKDPAGGTTPTPGTSLTTAPLVAAPLPVDAAKAAALLEQRDGRVMGRDAASLATALAAAYWPDAADTSAHPSPTDRSPRSVPVAAPPASTAIVAQLQPRPVIAEGSVEFGDVEAPALYGEHIAAALGAALLATPFSLMPATDGETASPSHDDTIAAAAERALALTSEATRQTYTTPHYMPAPSAVALPLLDLRCGLHVLLLHSSPAYYLKQDLLLDHILRGDGLRHCSAGLQGTLSQLALAVDRLDVPAGHRGSVDVAPLARSSSVTSANDAASVAGSGAGIGVRRKTAHADKSLPPQRKGTKKRKGGKGKGRKRATVVAVMGDSASDVGPEDTDDNVGTSDDEGPAAAVFSGSTHPYYYEHRPQAAAPHAALLRACGAGLHPAGHAALRSLRALHVAMARDPFVPSNLLATPPPTSAALQLSGPPLGEHCEEVVMARALAEFYALPIKKRARSLAASASVALLDGPDADGSLDTDGADIGASMGFSSFDLRGRGALALAAGPLLALTATHTGFGILVTDGGAGTIRGCTLHSNRSGSIVVTTRGDPLVTDCRVASTGPSAHGSSGPHGAGAASPSGAVVVASGGLGAFRRNRFAGTRGPQMYITSSVATAPATPIAAVGHAHAATTVFVDREHFLAQVAAPLLRLLLAALRMPAPVPPTSSGVSAATAVEGLIAGIVSTPHISENEFSGGPTFFGVPALLPVAVIDPPPSPSTNSPNAVGILCDYFSSPIIATNLFHSFHFTSAAVLAYPHGTPLSTAFLAASGGAAVVACHGSWPIVETNEIRDCAVGLSIRAGAAGLYVRNNIYGHRYFAVICDASDRTAASLNHALGEGDVAGAHRNAAKARPMGVGSPNGGSGAGPQDASLVAGLYAPTGHPLLRHHAVVRLRRLRAAGLDGALVFAHPPAIVENLIADCGISGALCLGPTDAYHPTTAAAGTVHLVLQRNEIYGNSNCGVEALHGGAVALYSNRVYDNTHHGCLAAGAATLTALKNTFSGNGGAAVFAKADSVVAITSNIIMDAQGPGIHLAGASGAVEGNRVFGGRGGGIVVDGLPTFFPRASTRSAASLLRGDQRRASYQQRGPGLGDAAETASLDDGDYPDEGDDDDDPSFADTAFGDGPFSSTDRRGSNAGGSGAARTSPTQAVVSSPVASAAAIVAEYVFLLKTRWGLRADPNHEGTPRLSKDAMAQQLRLRTLLSIQKNEIGENKGAGLTVTGDVSARCVVTHNIVTLNSGGGVLCDGAAACEVIQNTVKDNALFGVACKGSSTPHLLGNIIARTTSGDGIVADGRCAPHIEHNLVAFTPSGSGIRFSHGARGMTSGNALVDNRVAGILLEHRHTAPTIQHCLVCANNIGNADLVEAAQNAATSSGGGTGLDVSAIDPTTGDSLLLALSGSAAVPPPSAHSPTRSSAAGGTSAFIQRVVHAAGIGAAETLALCADPSAAGGGFCGIWVLGGAAGNIMNTVIVGALRQGIRVVGSESAPSFDQVVVADIVCSPATARALTDTFRRHMYPLELAEAAAPRRRSSVIVAHEDTAASAAVAAVSTATTTGADDAQKANAEANDPHGSADTSATAASQPFAHPTPPARPSAHAHHPGAALVTAMAALHLASATAAQYKDVAGPSAGVLDEGGGSTYAQCVVLSCAIGFVLRNGSRASIEGGSEVRDCTATGIHITGAHTAPIVEHTTIVGTGHLSQQVGRLDSAKDNGRPNGTALGAGIFVGPQASPQLFRSRAFLNRTGILTEGGGDVVLCEAYANFDNVVVGAPGHHRGAPNVVGCTFYDAANIGLWVRGGWPRIQHCYGYDSGHATALVDGGGPTIEDCRFFYARDDGALVNKSTTTTAAALAVPGQPNQPRLNRNLVRNQLSPPTGTTAATASGAVSGERNGDLVTTNVPATVIGNPSERAAAYNNQHSERNTNRERFCLFFHPQTGSAATATLGRRVVRTVDAALSDTFYLLAAIPATLTHLLAPANAADAAGGAAAFIASGASAPIGLCAPATPSAMTCVNITESKIMAAVTSAVVTNHLAPAAVQAAQASASIASVVLTSLGASKDAGRWSAPPLWHLFDPLAAAPAAPVSSLPNTAAAGAGVSRAHHAFSWLDLVAGLLGYISGPSDDHAGALANSILTSAALTDRSDPFHRRNGSGEHASEMALLWAPPPPPPATGAEASAQGPDGSAGPRGVSRFGFVSLATVGIPPAAAIGSHSSGSGASGGTGTRGRAGGSRPPGGGDVVGPNPVGPPPTQPLVDVTVHTAGPTMLVAGFAFAPPSRAAATSTAAAASTAGGMMGPLRPRGPTVSGHWAATTAAVHALVYLPRALAPHSAAPSASSSAPSAAQAVPQHYAQGYYGSSAPPSRELREHRAVRESAVGAASLSVAEALPPDTVLALYSTSPGIVARGHATGNSAVVAANLATGSSIAQAAIAAMSAAAGVAEGSSGGGAATAGHVNAGSGSSGSGGAPSSTSPLFFNADTAASVRKVRRTRPVAFLNWSAADGSAAPHASIVPLHSLAARVAAVEAFAATTAAIMFLPANPAAAAGTGGGSSAPDGAASTGLAQDSSSSTERAQTKAPAAIFFTPAAIAAAAGAASTAAFVASVSAAPKLLAAAATFSAGAAPRTIHLTPLQQLAVALAAAPPTGPLTALCAAADRFADTTAYESSAPNAAAKIRGTATGSAARHPMADVPAARRLWMAALSSAALGIAAAEADAGSFGADSGSGGLPAAAAVLALTSPQVASAATSDLHGSRFGTGSQRLLGDMVIALQLHLDTLLVSGPHYRAATLYPDRTAVSASNNNNNGSSPTPALQPVASGPSSSPLPPSTPQAAEGSNKAATAAGLYAAQRHQQTRRRTYAAFNANRWSAAARAFLSSGSVSAQTIDVKAISGALLLRSVMSTAATTLPSVYIPPLSSRAAAPILSTPSRPGTMGGAWGPARTVGGGGSGGHALPATGAAASPAALMAALYFAHQQHLPSRPPDGARLSLGGFGEGGVPHRKSVAERRRSVGLNEGPATTADGHAAPVPPMRLSSLSAVLAVTRASFAAAATTATTTSAAPEHDAWWPYLLALLVDGGSPTACAIDGRLGIVANASRPSVFSLPGQGAGGGVTTASFMTAATISTCTQAPVAATHSKASKAASPSAAGAGNAASGSVVGLAMASLFSLTVCPNAWNVTDGGLGTADAAAAAASAAQSSLSIAPCTYTSSLRPYLPLLPHRMPVSAPNAAAATPEAAAEGCQVLVPFVQSSACGDVGPVGGPLHLLRGFGGTGNGGGVDGEHDTAALCSPPLSAPITAVDGLGFVLAAFTECLQATVASVVSRPAAPLAATSLVNLLPIARRLTHLSRLSQTVAQATGSSGGRAQTTDVGLAALVRGPCSTSLLTLDVLLRELTCPDRRTMRDAVWTTAPPGTSATRSASPHPPPTASSPPPPSRSGASSPAPLAKRPSHAFLANVGSGNAACTQGPPNPGTYAPPAAVTVASMLLPLAEVIFRLWRHLTVFAALHPTQLQGVAALRGLVAAFNAGSLGSAAGTTSNVAMVPVEVTQEFYVAPAAAPLLPPTYTAGRGNGLPIPAPPSSVPGPRHLSVRPLLLANKALDALSSGTFTSSSNSGPLLEPPRRLTIVRATLVYPYLTPNGVAPSRAGVGGINISGVPHVFFLSSFNPNSLLFPPPHAVMAPIPAGKVVAAIAGGVSTSLLAAHSASQAMYDPPDLDTTPTKSSRTAAARSAAGTTTGAVSQLAAVSDLQRAMAALHSCAYPPATAQGSNAAAPFVLTPAAMVPSAVSLLTSGGPAPAGHHLNTSTATGGLGGRDKSLVAMPTPPTPGTARLPKRNNTLLAASATVPAVSLTSPRGKSTTGSIVGDSTKRRQSRGGSVDGPPSGASASKTPRMSTAR